MHFIHCFEMNENRYETDGTEINKLNSWTTFITVGFFFSLLWIYWFSYHLYVTWACSSIALQFSWTVIFLAFWRCEKSKTKTKNSNWTLTLMKNHGQVIWSTISREWYSASMKSKVHEKRKLKRNPSDWKCLGEIGKNIIIIREEKLEIQFEKNMLFEIFWREIRNDSFGIGQISNSFFF